MGTRCNNKMSNTSSGFAHNDKKEHHGEMNGRALSI